MQSLRVITLLVSMAQNKLDSSFEDFCSDSSYWILLPESFEVRVWSWEVWAHRGNLLFGMFWDISLRCGCSRWYWFLKTPYFYIRRYLPHSLAPFPSPLPHRTPFSLGLNFSSFISFHTNPHILILSNSSFFCFYVGIVSLASLPPTDHGCN